LSAGDFYQDQVLNLANGADLVLDFSGTDTNALEIHNIIHGADCDVHIYNPTTGLDIVIDSLTGNGISQINKIELNSDGDVEMYIQNTSGGAADYVVTGIEILG
jgi:hypothetical protein